MKQLKCEMCGSAELIKQDGVFVCQSCGCKYSVEDAKKMMVEVSGSVSIETPIEVKNAAQLENLLKLAITAYNSKDFEKAESLCDQIIAIDANCIEAWMCKGKCSLWKSTLEDLRINQAIQNFDEAIKVTPSNNIEQTKIDIANEVLSFTYSFVELFSDFYFVSAPNPLLSYSKYNECFRIMQEVLIPYIQQNGVSTSKHLSQMAIVIENKVMKGNELIHIRSGLTENVTYLGRADHAIKILKYMLSLFSENDKSLKIDTYKNIITILTMQEAYNGSYKINGVYFKDKMSSESKEKAINEIMEYHNKIKELDSNYVIPERPQKTGGCYVATCVYGAYDCPQVWTLRRYRDNTLAKTILGKAFIRTYYAISPTLVKWFGDATWFKRMWKGILDKMVSKLQDNGVEDTPYEDKNW